MILQILKGRMALAGIVMTAFLVIHMLLNLQFFQPQDFNQFYSAYHDSLIRWVILMAIAVILGFHVAVAFKIRRQNARARQIDYQKQDKLKIPASLVSVSLLFLFIFIIVHIFQTLFFSSNDIYHEVSVLFNSSGMVLFYLAGLLVLMMHLQHALANVLQTLGKSASHYHWTAILISLILTAGFAFVPISIFIGN